MRVIVLFNVPLFVVVFFLFCFYTKMLFILVIVVAERPAAAVILNIFRNVCSFVIVNFLVMNLVNC